MRDYWVILRLFSRNVRLFMLATAVHGFVFFGIYALLLNLYLIRLGYGPQFIGVVNGVGPLMLAIFSLPAGFVSRRVGSRRVMMGGYVLSSISFALMPLSQYVPAVIREAWIVGSYALVWTAGAFIIVNFAPYLMTSTGERERNHAFAIQSSLFPLAGFVGSFLGGTLPSLFARLGDVTLDSPLPYRNALLVAAALDLLAALAIGLTAEVVKTTVAPETEGASTKRPPSYRLILLFSLVSFFMVAGEWTIRVYYNVYLDSQLSSPTALIGAISAGALLMGLTALLSPSAAALWGRHRVVLIGSLGIFAAFLPIIFIVHWLAVAFTFMIVVAAISLTNPTFLVFSQSVVEPRDQSIIASAISMSIGVAVALTSFGGGYIIATLGYRPLFVMGAIAGLLAATIVWRFLPRERA